MLGLCIMHGSSFILASRGSGVIFKLISVLGGADVLFVRFYIPETYIIDVSVYTTGREFFFNPFVSRYQELFASYVVCGTQN